MDTTAEPAHITRAREILAAKLGTRFELPDGPLVICHGGWSKEAADRAGKVGVGGSPEWFAALGPYEHATLTADGHGVERTGWCACRPQPSGETWVRYEGWTAEGRVAHGYACPTCRRITQTG